MMCKPSLIAIDGPAGSGKSTLGKKLADQLGYLYFDTGVMYRAITWVALQDGIDVQDEEAVTSISQNVQIDVRLPSKEDGRGYDVLVDGQDITWEIRRKEVDSTVSIVSAYPGVRQALTVQQRRIGLRGGVVMVGRDIGTVVLPESELKIYLDASPEVRAKRRYAELQARAEDASLEDILKSIRHRDEFDSTRDIAPLRPAENAVILDSSEWTIEETFSKLINLVEEHCE